MQNFVGDILYLSWKCIHCHCNFIPVPSLETLYFENVGTWVFLQLSASQAVRLRFVIVWDIFQKQLQWQTIQNILRNYLVAGQSLLESTLNSQQHISNMADKIIVEIQPFCQGMMVPLFSYPSKSLHCFTSKVVMLLHWTVFQNSFLDYVSMLLIWFLQYRRAEDLNLEILVI